MCANDTDYTTLLGPRYAMEELSSRWSRLGTVLRHDLAQPAFLDLTSASPGGERFLASDSPAISVVRHQPGAGFEVAAQLQADLLVADHQSALPRILCEPGQSFGAAQGGPSVALDHAKVATAVQSAPTVAPGDKAKGLRVALLDTGLQNAAHAMVQFTGAKVDTVPADDPHGHGTAVARLITAVNPGADVYPVRVLGPQLRGESYEVLAGLAYALWPQQFDIVNASLVSQTSGRCPTSLGRLIDYLFAMCRANGGPLPVLVAAAGNDPKAPHPGYPAKMLDAVVVTAVDAAGQPAVYNSPVPASARRKEAYGGDSGDLLGSVSYPHDPGRASHSLWGTSLATGIVTGAYLP